LSGERLVGIFGAGRNGSTLIARLLDGSPDLWIHPIDVVFLPLWDDLATRGRVRGESARTATVRPLRNLSDRLDWRSIAPVFAPQVDEIAELYLPELEDPYELRRQALAALDRDGATTPAEFFPAFLEAARRASAREPEPAPARLGFKTSETAYVDDFVRLWPEMSFVHIVRHPIHNYASAKRTWMRGKRTPFWTHGEDVLRVFLESRWVPHAEAVLRYREADPDHHLLVRYEDLCADAEGEVLRLCEALGVHPPHEPALQTALGGERLRELPRNPSAPGVATPQHVVRDMATRFGYDEIVAPREAELIARRVGALGRALGYDDLPDPRGRVAMWLSWLPVESSERQNVRNWGRWLLELAKRRAYVTRMILLS
jgi:hypothetical protein